MPPRPVITHRIVDNKTVKLDPFIAIDDFTVEFPAAFLDHPHRGFESATFILPEQTCSESRLLYYDSTLGQEEKQLGPGGLVRMICGRGISHCEVVQERGHRMRAINFWFNYPMGDKMCQAWSKIYKLGTEQMPVAVLKDGTVRVIVLQGSYQHHLHDHHDHHPLSLTGHCFEPCPVKLECIHLTLFQQDTNITIDIQEGWNAIIYCISGRGFVNGDELVSCHYQQDEDGGEIAERKKQGKTQRHNKDKTFKIMSIHDLDYHPNQKRSFHITRRRRSTNNDNDDDDHDPNNNDDVPMELIFIAGEPVGLPMIVFDLNEDGSSGTFVMSSEDDIKTSLNDWIRGKNGFEYRHSWISPGMQSINNHWEGQETPAQERIEDPITQQISGQKVKMMRRKSLEVVTSCRQQQGQQGSSSSSNRRRRSLDFVRQFREGKDGLDQDLNNSFSNIRPTSTGMAATATTRRRPPLSFTNIRDYWKNKKQ